jgi:hypothetical protein
MAPWHEAISFLKAEPDAYIVLVIGTQSLLHITSSTNSVSMEIKSEMRPDPISLVFEPVSEPKVLSFVVDLQRSYGTSAKSPRRAWGAQRFSLT